MDATLTARALWEKPQLEAGLKIRLKKWPQWTRRGLRGFSGRNLGVSGLDDNSRQTPLSQMLKPTKKPDCPDQYKATAGRQ